MVTMLLSTPQFANQKNTASNNSHLLKLFCLVSIYFTGYKEASTASEAIAVSNLKQNTILLPLK